MPKPLWEYASNSHLKGWLVEGLIPKGHIVLVAGPEGIGKSWFTEALAVSIASGTKFLNTLDVSQGSVFLVDMDSPEDLAIERLVKLSRAIKADIDRIPLYPYPQSSKFQITDSAVFASFLKDVEEAKPTLVVLDCLAKVTGDKFNENRSEDAGLFFQRVNAIRNIDSTTVVYVHHFGKKEGDFETQFRMLIRGSSRFLADADTALAMASSRPGTFNVRPQEKRARLGVNYTFGVQIQDSADGLKTWLNWSDITLASPTEEAKRVFEIFRAHPEAIYTVRELYEKSLGQLYAIQDLRFVLRELEREGVVLLGLSGSSHMYTYRLNPELDEDKPTWDWMLLTSYQEELFSEPRHAGYTEEVNSTAYTIKRNKRIKRTTP